MADWKADKDLGPWAFQEQRNKWGYLNDPRWKPTSTDKVSYDRRTDEPQIWETEGKFSSGGRPKHSPCGHWHKPLPPTTGAPIYCIQYDSEVRTTSYPNTSGDLVSGDALIYQGGYLYGGAVSTGYLFKVDPSTMAIADSATFDAADVSAIHQLVYYSGYLYALISRSGYTGKWIQKISLALALVDPPMYAGTVVYGTDGHVYGVKGESIYSTWVNTWKPVTYAGWASYWELLPDDYPYYIAALAEYIGLMTANGATIIDFKMTAAGFIFNSGPSSAIAATGAFVSQFDFTGQKIIGFAGHLAIGPNELAVNPSDNDQFVTIRKTSIYSTLKMRFMDLAGAAVIIPLAAPHNIEYTISGLLDPLGAPDTSVFYHYRTIWHTNGRVYCMFSAYPPGNHTWIFSVDPTTGNLIDQYIIDALISTGSFVILGNYVYVWQNGIKDASYTSAIIKLNLDLEFVCIENCDGGSYGGLYNENGRNIVSDGGSFIYNYGRASMGSNNGLVTKYEVP